MQTSLVEQAGGMYADDMGTKRKMIKPTKKIITKGDLTVFFIDVRFLRN